MRWLAYRRRLQLQNLPPIHPGISDNDILFSMQFNKNIFVGTKTRRMMEISDVSHALR